MDSSSRYCYRQVDNPSIWIDVLGVTAGVLAGVWVPLAVGLIHITPATARCMDALFFLLAGPAAFLSWRAIAPARQRGESRDVYALEIRFLLDLLVALPLVTLAGLYGASSAAFCALKLVAVIHVFRFPGVLARRDTARPAACRLLALVVLVPLSVHWTATGWILLSGGDTGEPHALRYAHAVYWAITTLCTVGYGDITPKTLPQMAYACGTMLMGVGFFGYILSNITSLVARLDAAKVHHEELRNRIEAFMHHHHVPADMRRRVQAYFRYLWDSRRGYDDAAALGTLPPNLRADLVLWVNRELIEKVPFFQGASPDFLRELVQHLKSQVALPSEDIFRLGAPGDELYFILHGNVDILDGGGQLICRLTEGQFFGEMALLHNRPRNATARAVSWCDLCVLRRHDFEHTLKRYPELEQFIHATAEARETRPPPPASRPADATPVAPC